MQELHIPKSSHWFVDSKKDETGNKAKKMSDAVVVEKADIDINRY